MTAPSDVRSTETVPPVRSPALRFLRRFMILSPQITILTVVGMLLLLAMVGLGGLILRQVSVNQQTIGFNYSSVNRPFSQLGREVLLILSVIQSNTGAVDEGAFATERNVLESRWQVVFWEPVQRAFPQEVQQKVAEMEQMWGSLQPLLDAWVEDPSAEPTRTTLTTLLLDFESLIFRTDVRYQALRGVLLDETTHSSENLLLAMGVVVLLLAGFITLTARSIFRYVQAQKQTDNRISAALAAEAAAIESSKFKDQFLAVMSHELRTPLNSIIGFLGVLGMTGKLEERNLRMVQKARANADRLLLIINDILDISKIESGQFEIAAAPVDVREMVQRWQFQMDVLAKQKHLAFIVDIDPHLPRTLSLDENAMTKVATNLLSNAIKFTDKGEVRMTLRRQGQLWTLAVNDTGIGIPEDMHDAVFETFRQVDNSFKRAHGGTGLGLSIVQHLVKEMGGSIRLQSTVGVGSTFTVTLPLTPVTDAAPETTPHPGPLLTEAS